MLRRLWMFMWSHCDRPPSDISSLLHLPARNIFALLSAERDRVWIPETTEHLDWGLPHTFRANES